MTILSAISLSGMIATMTIEEPTDSDIFLAYVEHVLCPELKDGQVVVMDNLSSHKTEGVCALIEKRGANVLYLPPYSPDLNPIEKAWAKLKQLLRSAKARTKQALEQAITDILPSITPQDAKAWFRLRLGTLQYLCFCFKRRFSLTGKPALLLWAPFAAYVKKVWWAWRTAKSCGRHRSLRCSGSSTDCRHCRM